MPPAPASDDPLADATIGTATISPLEAKKISQASVSSTNSGVEPVATPITPIGSAIWNSFAGPGNDSSAVSVAREIPRAFGSNILSGVGYTAFNSVGLVTAFGGAVVDGIGRTMVEHGASLFRAPDLQSAGWWAKTTAGALEVTGGAVLAILGTSARVIGNGICRLTRNQ
jgi:hypothetical protein